MGCCQSSFQDVTANVPLDKETSEVRRIQGGHANAQQSENAIAVLPLTAAGGETSQNVTELQRAEGRRSQTTALRISSRESSVSASRVSDEQHRTRRVLPATHTPISIENVSLGEMALARSTNTTASVAVSSTAVVVSDDDVSGATVSARETLMLEPTQLSPPLAPQFPVRHHYSLNQPSLHPHGNSRRTPVSEDAATNTTNPLTPRLANLSFVSVAVRTPSTSMIGAPRTPQGLAGGRPLSSGTPRHRPSEEDSANVTAASHIALHDHRLRPSAGISVQRAALSPTNESRTCIRSPFGAPLMVANDYLRRSQHWVPMEPMMLPPAAGTPSALFAGNARWSVSSGSTAIQVPTLSNTNSGNSLTVNRRVFTVAAGGELNHSQRSSVSGNGDLAFKGPTEDSRDYTSMGNNQSNSFAMPDAHMEESGRGTGCDVGVLELSQSRSERRKGGGHAGSVVTFSEGALVLANGSSSDEDDDDDDREDMNSNQRLHDHENMRAPAPVLHKSLTPTGPGSSSHRPEGGHINVAVIPLWNGDSSFASQRAVSRRARESSQSS
jgi:hypothetical protein